MNRSSLWLLLFFTPLLIIIAITLSAFFISSQSHIPLLATILAFIPVALPASLITYIVANKYFLQISRKTILITAATIILATSSATLWTTLLYFNPQLMSDALPYHAMTNIVHQHWQNREYTYSWTQYPKNAEKKKTYTIYSSEKKKTRVQSTESTSHIKGYSNMENNHLFQPFLKHLIYNAKQHSTQQPFIIVLSFCIMLSCIYIGISLASLWATNIFTQAIFLINAHGILNILLNLLIPYVWFLIGIMTLVIILLVLFVIFRLYYGIDNEETPENEKYDSIR